MLEYALPVLFALFVWWFTTGLVIYLDGLPARTFKWSMLGATALLLAAAYGLTVTSTDTSVYGAYAAFTCGLVIWGWHEMSFLMGFVTGPRTDHLPPRCTRWQRFVFALETVLYHELAIVVTAIMVIALTAGQPNQIGTWTFAVLWMMRLSAKLNVFFGVPNITEEFLPEHLKYLKSYFRKASMNAFFPIAVTASTIVTGALIEAAASTSVPFEIAGLTLIATLMALAVLEHWFLVLPLPAAALWEWGLTSHNANEQERAPQDTLDAKVIHMSPRDDSANSSPRALRPAIAP